MEASTYAPGKEPKEIWRQKSEDGLSDYYMPSISIIEPDGVQISVGGCVVVKPIQAWLDLAWPPDTRSSINKGE